MGTLYLIRHGTTESNFNGRFQGSADIPLNELGQKQAEFLEKRFRNINIDAVYSSPLIRARQTAESICRSKRHVLKIFDGLKEIDGGELEGRTAEENREKYPEAMDIFRVSPALFKAPGGESAKQVFDRFSFAINDILAQNRNKTVAVVSHGFAIQTYFTIAKGIPFEKMERHIVGNTSVSKFLFDDDLKSTIQYLGDDSHLPEEFKFTIASNFIK